MAKSRGLLTGPDLNEVQERILMNSIIDEQVEEFKKSDEEFEKLLMIHRPEVWTQIQEEREEAQEMGFDEIVWKSPDSLEEFEEIERLIMGNDLDPETGNILIGPSATHFQGIDLDELGEELD